MTTSHLEPGAVARAATGDLTDAERNEVLAHLEACASCRDDVTYAAAFERRARNRRVLTVSSLIAAAVAVVALLPFGSPSSLPSPDPTMSVRSGGEGVPQVAVYEPVSGAELTGDTLRFVWADMGEHTQYRLWLSTAGGAPLWDQASSDTVAYVDVRSVLDGGGTYLWFVDALLADGGTAQSKVRSLTVRE